jgi:TetR/AcrR family transcriptional regulator, cholesterol catabolism regulator
MQAMKARESSTKGASGIGKRRTAAKEDSSESYQKRRKEIAEAAVRVFNRKGFAGASISAVAEELEIDRASIYYYISSKEELFDEILREVIEKNAEIATRIQASSLQPRRKLHDLVIALMTSFGEHYPLIYIYIREDLSKVVVNRSAWSKHMQKLNRTIEDAIVAVVEEGYADKSFRHIGPPRIVVAGILGVVGWTHRWFRPEKSPIGAQEIGRIYADMILSGLESTY